MATLELGNDRNGAKMYQMVPDFASQLAHVGTEELVQALGPQSAALKSLKEMCKEMLEKSRDVSAMPSDPQTNVHRIKVNEACELLVN